MGTDERIITTEQKNTWIVIRHNLGKNFSYIWNRMILHLFERLQDQVDIVTEYDDTTISIRLKKEHPYRYRDLNKTYSIFFGLYLVTTYFNIQLLMTCDDSKNVYIVIVLIYRLERSNGNNGACTASDDASEASKSAEIN